MQCRSRNFGIIEKRTHWPSRKGERVKGCGKEVFYGQSMESSWDGVAFEKPCLVFQARTSFGTVSPRFSTSCETDSLIAMQSWSDAWINSVPFGLARKLCFACVRNCEWSVELKEFGIVPGREDLRDACVYRDTIDGWCI